MSPSKRWDSRDVLSNFSLKDSTIAQICDLFIVPSLETILRHIVTSLSIPYETFCIWLYYGVLWFCMLGRAPSTFWPILAPMNLKKVWKTIGKQRKNMKQSQPCDDHPRELQLRIPHFLGKASSQTAWRAGWNENRSAVVQNYGHVTGIVEATWLYIYIYRYILFSPFIFLSSDICLSMHHRASTRDPGKQILHDSGHIEASNNSYTILSYLHSAQINVLSFCCKRRAPASANCASRQTWRRHRPELTLWCTSLHRTSNNRKNGSKRWQVLVLQFLFEICRIWVLDL